MSDTIAKLTYEQSRRNEHLIDEAAMDERLSQSFRRDACIFAGECGIAIKDKQHAHAFFKYYRSHAKVEKLIRKAAGKFGYGEHEIAGAIAMVRADLRLPDSLAEARILLSCAREQMAKGKPLPSPAGNACSPGMPQAKEPAPLAYATPFSIIPPAVSGQPIVPRQPSLEQLAKELDAPAQATGEPDGAGQVSAASIQGVPAEKKVEEKTPGFQKPRNRQEKRAYRLLRDAARKNGFSEEELHKAMELCRKYQWQPRAPLITIRKKTRERREELGSQALDLLNQARMGYDYIDSIGSGSLPEGEVGRRATRNIKALYSHYGQRIVSDEVRRQLGEEYKFLSSHAEYVSAYGASRDYPIRAIAEARERLLGRAIPGSKWVLPAKSQIETPGAYARKVLELARGSIGDETGLIPKRTPIADNAGKVNNFNMIHLACREERQRTKGAMQYSVEVQKLAQASSEARGKLFSSWHDAKAYLDRAKRYADADASRPALALIKQAARKFGFTAEEAQAAHVLSRDHLVAPANINEAGDLLLQARLASRGRPGDYIWGIAQEGLHPYSAALMVERRYLANGTPLTREQAISMLNDEKEFQEDPYAFAEKVARMVAVEESFGSHAVAPSMEEPRVVALGYTLAQFLNGKVDKRLPTSLLRLPRWNQAYVLLTNPAYQDVLLSKWEEYQVAQAAVKKAAEEYSKLVSVDLDAGKAVVEALGRIRNEGENPMNLTQAIALFKDTLWQVKNKSALQARVKRALIPQEIADAAWARILPLRMEFGSVDEEMAFYAGLCEERGLPYPAKLLAYLHYHAGRISREAAEAAIARLDMCEPELKGREEALAFISQVEAELRPSAAPAKAKPQLAYRPSPHRKVDPHQSTAYARTVIGGNGGALMFRMAQVQGPQALLQKPEAAPSSAGEGAETDAQEAPARGLTIQQVPPIKSFSTPFQQDPIPLQASRLILAGSAAAPGAAHPESLQMAEDSKGRTIKGPALPAPATLPVSVPVPDSKEEGVLLTSDGKILPPDQWATVQRPAPTEAEIAAAEKEAPQTAAQAAESLAATTLVAEEPLRPEGEMPSARNAPQPEPTPEEIARALAEKAEKLKAEEHSISEKGEKAVLAPPDQWATVQMPAPTLKDMEASDTPSSPHASVPEEEKTVSRSEPEPSQALAISSDIDAAFERVSLPPSSATMVAPPPMVLLERAKQPEPPQSLGAAGAQAAPAAEPVRAAISEAAGAPAATEEPTRSIEQAAPEAPSPSSPTIIMSPAQREALAEESRAAKDYQRDELRTMHYARRLYHSRDPAKRMEAVDELARMGTPAALYALAGALGQGSDVSSLAASVLLSYKDEALFSLASVLEEGSDSGKSRAISILVQIGTQGAYDTLARALLDDEYVISGEAAFHLLLAQGTGLAETRKHFHSIPDAKAIQLIGAMLSGAHPASDLESMVLRAESADVLAGLLEAKPWLARDVKPDTWLNAIGEWARAGTKRSLSSIALALDSSEGRVCSEAAFYLLLSTAEGKADNSIPLVEHYFHNPDLPQDICSVARRKMAPDAEVQALVDYYFSSPRLQPLMLGLLSACDPAKAIPQALSKNRLPERNVNNDIAIKQLLQEAYGSSCMEHIADCAAREYPAAIASGDKAAIRAAVEEAHFLLSVLPGGSPKEPSLRFLEAVLPLVPHMDTAQKTSVFGFARRLDSGALPLLLAYARNEAKSGRPLGNETIELLIPVLAHIGRKEGIEFFGCALPEAAGMDSKLRGALAELAAKLDPGRAEAMLLDHANSMAVSRRLSREAMLAIISIEDRLLPRNFGLPAPRHFAGAELLLHALPMLNSMGSNEKQMVGHFAMKCKAAALPFVLGYADSEARAGRPFGAENIMLLSAVVDYIGEKDGVEMLSYALPEIAALDAEQLNNIKDILALDHERAERILLGYAAARRSQAAPFSKKEALAIMELGAETARLAELSKGTTSCAELFACILPWLGELSGEEFAVARSVCMLDPTAAEKALVEYANGKAAESKLSKGELFSLMAMEHELAALAASSGRRPMGAALLQAALPMLREMDAHEATALAHFASSENIREGALQCIESHMDGFSGRATIPKEEFAAVALALARIGNDRAFALLSRLFEEESTEIMRAMQDALSANYNSLSESGERPVRETLLRAALGRKTEGRKCRDQKDELSSLGTVAFEIIASQKDAARDVIEGCKEAHLCTAEEEKKASRMLQAQELLVKIGDEAIRDLSEAVFSDDLSQYPAFYKANLLKTIAQMAGRSDKQATKELAKECLMKAVADFRLGEEMVGRALGTIRINAVKDLALLLLPDTSPASARMEDRATGILASMGPQVHVEIAQMLASRDPTQRRCAALAVKALLSRWKNPAEALKADPQLQANLDAIPRLLLDQDKNVRDAAEAALEKLWMHVSLSELERTIRLRREKYSDMLPYQDEVSQRRKAATLLSMRGEQAIDHFLSVMRDPGLNQDVVRACIDAAVFIGDSMLEKMVGIAEGKGISDKFYLLHSAARCGSPIGRLLSALFSHAPEWEGMMAEGGTIQPWKSKLLQWFVVEGVVLRRDEAAAEAASRLSGSAVLSMEAIARDFREAVDAKVELCGWPRDDALSLSNIDILERSGLGIDTSAIRAEFGKTPKQGDPSFKDKYRGFLRQRTRVQPPPLGRKLTAQNGGNGGAGGH